MADICDNLQSFPLLESFIEACEDEGPSGYRVCDFFVREVGWVEHVCNAYSVNGWATANLEIHRDGAAEFSTFEVLSHDIIAARYRNGESSIVTNQESAQ